MARAQHERAVETRPEPAPVRVLLVDDHDVFRRGLARLFGEHGLRVVGETTTGEQAIEVVNHTRPDVVVLELGLPGISGVEATRELLAAAPQARVLVLTLLADEAHVTEAVRASACGYLIKDASIGEIVAGVRAAAAGESLVSPRVAGILIERVRQQGRVLAPERGVQLSARELEVLRLVTSGMDNAEIADALVISRQTVKRHISNMLAKLGVENRIQAAVYAVRNGIV